MIDAAPAPTAQPRTRRRVPRPATTLRMPRARRTREALIATTGSAALAVAMTWPALRDPARTVPQDLGDPLYFVWQLAWVGHALTTQPWDLWTTNAFSGAPGNLAYTDAVLGYAPISALGRGLDGALVTYNVLYVIAAALAFLGAYLLARVLGARWPGAIVVAAAFAYAPWRLAHDRHINVLSTGGIALALALLAYGHGWSLRRQQRAAELPRQAGPQGPPVHSRRPVRPRWVLAGWAVACWQLTLGFAVGVPFAWALLIVFVTAWLGWRASSQRRPWPRRLVVADAVGGAAFGLLGLALTIPYLRVVGDIPVARRTEEMVERYSPPVHGLVTAPPESWWWGSLHSGWRDGMTAPQEQTLLPGFVLLVLAGVGLVYSAWSVRHRWLLAGGAAVTALLALGTSAPGGGEYTYLALFRTVPGWEALRTPGRLILWVTLCLALLAAGAVTRAAESWSGSRGDGAAWRPAPASRRAMRRPGAWALTLVLAVPGALVIAEGVARMPQPQVPRIPVSLGSLPSPQLVLPASQQRDFLVMTWSTDGWPRLVNGGSGFESPAQSRLRREVAGFPDAASVEELRRRGVRTVVVVRSLAAGTTWAGAADRSTADLPLTRREQGDVVIFELEP
jgi:hypothetical protein